MARARPAGDAGARLAEVAGRAPLARVAVVAGAAVAVVDVAGGVVDQAAVGEHRLLAAAGTGAEDAVEAAVGVLALVVALLALAAVVACARIKWRLKVKVFWTVAQ